MFTKYSTALPPRKLVYLYFLFLTVFGIYSGYYTASFSNAIDASLGLAHLESFTQNASTSHWLILGKSLVHILGSFAFVLKIEHADISTLLAIITGLAYSWGLGLFSLVATRNIIFAAIITIVFSIEVPFGVLSVPYKLETIGSPHLSSAGAAFAFLSFGLAITKKHVLCIYATMTSIAVHPILGIFSILAVVASLISDRKIRKLLLTRKFYFHIAGALIIPVFVWCFYISISPFKSEFASDTADYATYLSIWDFHRRFELNITTSIILLGTFLILVFTQISHNRNQFHMQPFTIKNRISSSILIITSCSTFLYMLPYLNIPVLSELGNRVVSGRYISLLEPLLFIYFSAFSIHFLRNVSSQFISYSNTSVFINIIGMVILYIAMEHDFVSVYFKHKISSEASVFVLKTCLLVFLVSSVLLLVVNSKLWPTKYFRKNLSTQLMFCVALLAISMLTITENKIQKASASELLECPKFTPSTLGIAVDSNSTQYLQRLCNIPVLLDVSSFDYVAYKPSMATLLRSELETIYRIGFSDDSGPADLLSKRFRLSWEQRTEEEWVTLFDLYNVSMVVTPDSWVLNLPTDGSYSGLKTHTLP